MPTILGAAASGMVHNQNAMDVIGHNLANVNTSAYKKFRLLHEGAPDPNAQPEGGRLGVSDTTRDLVFSPASLQPTSGPLHFAIEDASFLRITDLDGSTVFTRYGALEADTAGNVLAFGGRAIPDAQTGEPIVVPDGWGAVAIDANGEVSAVNGEGERVAVGRVTLAQFVNPQGLEALGDGLYRTTANSGNVVIGTPASEGFAPLRPGALESSNVDMAEEFTNMIIAQRAYTACAKTFAVGDEMLAIATNITR